ncbi:MAG: DUF1727 domain-containing protein [Solobacterium sp.]|nr:DUF1727 domain-containing protein [Solobacterium sp.]
MDIRLFIVQKLHSLLAKAGRGGSFPGELALRMDPNFLKKFHLPKEVILITGTNGKTTTSNLIAESLRANGLKVLNNHRGDNLNVGIATTLASGSDDQYRIQADALVLEIDELTMYRQFDNLHPTTLVITNFFRDQLDRAGEMETIILKFIELMERFEGHLILNGDDPNVVRLADHAPKATIHFFSVQETIRSTIISDEAGEGKFCPRCGHPLVYEYYQYSHIGRFHCTHDGFGEITPDLVVRNIDFDRSMFQVGNQMFHSFVNSIYGVYNCAADLCLLQALGLDCRKADEVFRNYVLKEGRNEVFELQKPCTVNLIKNPTGANEVMKFIVAQPGDKNVCILLNDNDQDGHDISWIWDAHFERLNDPNIKTIVCSGLRAYDMALRLKYEGLEDRIQVIENPTDAIRWLDEANLESHVISTYTALHSTRAIIAKQAARRSTNK